MRTLAVAMATALAALGVASSATAAPAYSLIWTGTTGDRCPRLVVWAPDENATPIASDSAVVDNNRNFTNFKRRLPLYQVRAALVRLIRAVVRLFSSFSQLDYKTIEY